MSVKRNKKQKKKAFEDYYNSLSMAELREAIETTQERLRIMLTIRKEKMPILNGLSSSPTPSKGK